MTVQTTVSGDRVGGFIVEMHDGDVFHAFGAAAHELMDRFHAEFARLFNRAPEDHEAAAVVAVAPESV